MPMITLLFLLALLAWSGSGVLMTLDFLQVYRATRSGRFAAGGLYLACLSCWILTGFLLAVVLI